MSERILCVDDEANILQALRRGLRGQFQIDTALCGTEALEMIGANDPYAVIVSDMRMPGMDGAELLATVKQKTPDTVRMMLTGNADQQTAIEAINEGSIFRFLTKPCSPDALAKALEAGIRQHRLITGEKELLGKTLRGSVKVLSDVLSLVNPTAFGHTSRVVRLVKKIAAKLEAEDTWKLEMAAMLSHIGCVTLPPDVIEKVYHGQKLKSEESEMFGAHPSVGRDLVANIPRLEGVAEIIEYQEKRFDGGGVPENSKKGKEIPLGSRILKVARDFDILGWTGLTEPEAIQRMKERSRWYDPDVLTALETIAASESSLDTRKVKVRELTGRMILADPVRTTNGIMLAAKGVDVTASLKQRLINYSLKTPIEEPITVLVRP